MFRILRKILTKSPLISIETSKFSQSAIAFSVPWDSALKSAQDFVSKNSITRSTNTKEVFLAKYPFLAENFVKFRASNHPAVGLIESLLNKEDKYVRFLEVLLPLMIIGLRGSTSEKRDDFLMGQIEELVDAISMIYTAMEIHGRVQEIQGENFPNRAAILIGDFLLTKGNSQLSKFNYPIIIYWVSSSVANYVKADFLTKIPKETVVEFWRRKHAFTAGSLTGNACKSALKVAKYPESQLYDSAYALGNNFGLALRASIETDREQLEPDENQQRGKDVLQDIPHLHFQDPEAERLLTRLAIGLMQPSV